MKESCLLKIIELTKLDVENLAICTFSNYLYNRKNTIILDDVIVTPEDAILSQGNHNISIDPRYIKYTLKQLNNRTGIIYCHNHLKWNALFSKDDIRFGKKILKTTNGYLNNEINGLLVVTKSRYSIKMFDNSNKVVYNKFNSNIKRIMVDDLELLN